MTREKDSRVWTRIILRDPRLLTDLLTAPCRERVTDEASAPPSNDLILHDIDSTSPSNEQTIRH